MECGNYQTIPHCCVTPRTRPSSFDVSVCNFNPFIPTTLNVISSETVRGGEGKIQNLNLRNVELVKVCFDFMLCGAGFKNVTISLN